MGGDMDAGGSGGGFGAALKNIVSGSFGGIAQVFAGHPLDTVRIKLQAPGSEYSGMMDCFRKVWAAEGLGGLYKGATSPLAGAMAHNAALFFSYSMATSAVAGPGKSVHELSLSQVALSGALVGAAVIVVETPIDLFKIKMQSQGVGGQYASTWACAKGVVGTYGLRGAYQGAGATIIRNFPAFGSYFGAFEATRRVLAPSGEKPSLAMSAVAGGAAGFSFWVPFYPLELIKSRMQMDNSDPAKRQFRNILDCARKTYAEGGVAVFYRGYLPCVLRAVPVNSAVLFAVTGGKRAMGIE